jgi:hypothetical protein
LAHGQCWFIPGIRGWLWHLRESKSHRPLLGSNNHLTGRVSFSHLVKEMSATVFETWSTCGWLKNYIQIRTFIKTNFLRQESWKDLVCPGLFHIRRKLAPFKRYAVQWLLVYSQELWNHYYSPFKNVFIQLVPCPGSYLTLGSSCVCVMCMYVCMYVCMNKHAYMKVYVMCMYVWTYVYIKVCVMCMYVWTCACMKAYACMYVCMNMCMYEGVCVTHHVWKVRGQLSGVGSLLLLCDLGISLLFVFAQTPVSAEPSLQPKLSMALAVSLSSFVELSGFLCLMSEFSTAVGKRWTDQMSLGHLPL